MNSLLIFPPNGLSVKVLYGELGRAVSVFIFAAATDRLCTALFGPLAVCSGAVCAAPHTPTPKRRRTLTNSSSVRRSVQVINPNTLERFIREQGGRTRSRRACVCVFPFQSQKQKKSPTHARTHAHIQRRTDTQAFRGARVPRARQTTPRTVWPGPSTGYDNGGSCTPATSTGSSSIGLTSTPVSSGRSSNSNSSNSNGGSSVTSTPTAGGHDQAAGGNSSASVTPGAPGSSGHKGSIRGNKLARRARSFKDDFLEKISQIRTPTSTMTRSHSPNSPRGGAGGSGANAASYGSRKSTTDEPAKPVQDLNYHVRQVKNALTHFKDVILKNKLEMLPGNGTVVLESIANVHTALQSYTLNEHSSAFINATNHVHVSLGNLLKLCDEVLLTKEGDDCPSLSKENVKEVVELVENAVNNLVNLANEKLSDRKAIGTGGGGGPGTGVSGTAAGHSTGGPSSNTLQRPTVDVVSQRTSLPDIPLTPRERDILEQTSLKTVRASHSTESILRDSSPPPPPKPPLPDRSQEPPPPLPPKRKSQHAKNHSFHDTTTASSDCASTDSTIFQLGGGPGSSAGGATGAGGSIGLDRMSLRSRSPEDNCSLLSASAGSLDSALNHSREEDELRALTSCSSHASATAASLGGLVILGAGAAGCGTQHWEEAGDLAGGLPQHSNNSLNRNSNESGFESMYSLRVSRDQHQQQQQQQQMHMQYQSTAATVTTHHHHQKSASSSSSSSSYVHKSESIVDGMAALVVASGKGAVQQQHLQQHHQAHVLHHQQHQQQQQQHFHQKIDTIITQASDDSSAGPKGASEQLASATSLTSTVTTSSSSSLSKLLVHGPSIDELGNDDVFPRTSAGGATDRPPALPVKTRSHSIKRERHPSQYDNVDEVDLERGSQDSFGHFPMQSSPSYLYSRQQMFHNLPSKHISLIEPRHMSRFQEEPPPLPIKKKHMFQSVAYSVMAYMEIFGSATQNQSEFMRHSVHTYNLAHSEQISTSSTTSNHSISHSQTMSLSPSRIAPATVSPPSSPNVSVKPPALPPKRQRINSKTPSIASTPPPSPKIFQDQQQHHHAQHHYHQQQAQAPNVINTSPSPSTSSLASTQSGTGSKPSAVCNQTLDVKTPKNGMTMAMELQQQPLNLMEELDVSNYLVFKKENEDGPDVKGGHPDALIIHATRVQKNSDDDCLEDAYGEAFITTFRTFISPLDLIQKLSHRYTVYHCQMNDAKQKAAKESFSLLVRVVNDLTTPDLSERLLVILMNFDYQLVSAGHLTMAKLLRVKLIEKALIYKQKASLTVPTLSSRALVAQPPTLLDLKSAEIAEQMTLLDAELFQKIEIPEVLIWAQEQCEERSPNLTRFTEHFNKMSYWARTQILSQNDAKDREKHVIKFIKIMKHLRKINNYNSYLALLSALDSAPIRRLEWHKTITEGLKEYCALIDSSSSFRAYRQALAETNPPCIPYIGLVLQDLTFVHIGNPDLLPDGSTNFSKRWQQYHIVVNMKRFKKGSYPFKKNERIIGFFDNFEYYLDEDAMWQISETIKPRGSRKANVN
ncbi:guanine nucleotide-releasing factor 2 isoform X9 [Anopheles gambiae]|uniref:guanine nucleotide-releasing factor 2 isoform X9 n=1 Tax=Anopheles gambiae TaxID=7165 RepID=UPI002AC8A25C|nr:guanine nucleotide-releasing factor 2 isoform X9 [Anopheles gambiae]